MTQPWTGNKAGDVQGLPLAPNTPYWLMHHPETCWEFIQHIKQWMFLPTFEDYGNSRDVMESHAPKGWGL